MFVEKIYQNKNLNIIDQNVFENQNGDQVYYADLMLAKLYFEDKHKLSTVQF